MTLARLSAMTGIPVPTLRAAARRAGIKPVQTHRGPVFDMNAAQVRSLKKKLHGRRGRPRKD